MPKTVMIVEDHELNMKLFHDVLEAHGYHTICTRDGFKGDEERIRKGGCEAYLSKPISVPKFIETIRRFLGVGLSMPAVRRGNATAGRSRAARRTSS